MPSYCLPSPMTVGPVTLTFEQPILMGILNVTPDSFSDGGRIGSLEDGVRAAQELVAAGALVIDVGGESTRPGAHAISTEAEIERVVPMVAALTAAKLSAAISVDTSKAQVAKAAIAAGAHIVNDVTALGDPEMAGVVATSRAALILMHMRGEPRTMQGGTIEYGDLMGEIASVLSAAVDRAVAAGVERERIFVDPGIGFGKTAAHNLSITKHVGVLTGLGRPIVYGPSRKRFLGEVTGRAIDDRERATAAACVAAVLGGAHVLRVHDVAAVRDGVLVADAIRRAS